MTVYYLAGPMTGLPNFNFDEFNRVADLIRSKGDIVINPAENFGGRQDLPYTTYLRQAFTLLLGLDPLMEAPTAIILMNGWNGSRGAITEAVVASAVGLGVYALGPGNTLPMASLDDVDFDGASWRRFVAARRRMATADPRFKALLVELEEIHVAKRSDYTGTSGDLLFNYRTSAALAGTSTAVGIFARLCEKVARISSILKKDGDIQVKDETLADTCLDIANIALLLLIAFGETEAREASE